MGFFYALVGMLSGLLAVVFLNKQKKPAGNKIRLMLSSAGIGLSVGLVLSALSLFLKLLGVENNILFPVLTGFIVGIIAAFFTKTRRKDTKIDYQ